MILNTWKYKRLEVFDIVVKEDSRNIDIKERYVNEGEIDGMSSLKYLEVI